MNSLSKFLRTSPSLRSLAFRRVPTAGFVQTSRSRTLGNRLLSTQTSTSDEQKGNENTAENDPLKEGQSRFEHEIPGSRENVPPPRPRGIAPYLTGLLVIGVGFTSYGLYQFYVIMNMWPTEIRADLRSGLLAKRKGDLDIASQYLNRAWERAKTLPLEAFGSDPLIKMTGIGIALGEILEQDKKLEQAYKVYEDAFWYLRTAFLDLPPSTLDARPDLGVETLKGLSSIDKMRGIALSYKLGELAHTLRKSKKEEERWLVWSVEAVLRTVLDAPPMASAEVVRTVGSGGIGSGGERPNLKVLVEQLGLPLWAVRHDIAAPFEALASFYAKEGNVNYALPLYLQAISILIPPAPNVSPVEDKCRGAQLMGNVAELLVRNLDSKNATPEVVSQAEAWANKGLEVVVAARKISPKKIDVCEETFAVLLYNVAMVRELSGDTARARALLSESLAQSREIDMQEGIEHAENAIRELDSGAIQIKPLVVDAENNKAT